MIRDSLKAMIKRHEGWSDKVYLCPAGYKTVGWGHNIAANGLPEEIEAYLEENGHILTSHGEALLDNAIMLAQKACRRVCPSFDEFSEKRQDALIDFVFNLGEGGVRKFRKANGAINAGNWEEAARQMQDSRWYRQVGRRAKTVVGMVREGQGIICLEGDR